MGRVAVINSEIIIEPPKFLLYKDAMPWHGTWREIYNNGNYEYLNERQLDQKTNDKDKL